MDTWMTRAEAAKYLRVSLPTLDRHAAAGRITKYKAPGGRAVRFLREELDGLLAPQPKDEDPEAA
jgi:excisionase family DNA binding protein